ncbi:MAG: hypothetical protein AB7E76_13860 [Deferribacterales bacterium]
MLYVELADKLLKEQGVHLSTVMNFPCLRYNGEFICMYFRNDDRLLVKIKAGRVNELIDSGVGQEFRPAGKKFREWVLVPSEYEETFEGLMYEALRFAKERRSKK